MSDYYHNEDYYKGYQNGWKDGAQIKKSYANTGFMIGCFIGIVVSLLIVTIAAVIR